METIAYPIRINHYLALKKYCSRRMADKLIAEKKVKINGRLAIIGAKVEAGDKVEVDLPTLKKIAAERVFIAYNKPVGIITHGPQRGEQSIADILKYKTPLFPIGRLDKDSHGLIILTNDGRITDRLLNPKYDHEKEYAIRVNKKLRPGFLRHLGEGITLEDYRTKPAVVTKLAEDKFRIVLTEGKNRQIRKMCAAFNYEVRDLKRERIMNVRLGNLAAGQYRIIKDAELREFLSGVGL